MRALIASGSGRYADPWHPFARTSPPLARLLEDAGFETEIDDDVDRAMTRLTDVDLLVVNAGDPWRFPDDRSPAAPAASTDAFAAALERGIGVLAVHCAVASLRDYPEWAPAIGALWVPELSWHPPGGRTKILGTHLPGGSEVPDFDVDDERYCRLQKLARPHVVAWHAGDGSPEPAAWTRTTGRSRVAVDVLGHDERSYESAGHRHLLQQLALWAADSPASPDAPGAHRSR